MRHRSSSAAAAAAAAAAVVVNWRSHPVQQQCTTSCCSRATSLSRPSVVRPLLTDRTSAGRLLADRPRWTDGACERSRVGCNRQTHTRADRVSETTAGRIVGLAATPCSLGPNVWLSSADRACARELAGSERTGEFRMTTVGTASEQRGSSSPGEAAAAVSSSLADARFSSGDDDRCVV